MRKDYREPDDYEYEPTPHDDVLEKSETALRAAAADRRRGKYRCPKLSVDESDMSCDR